MAQYFVRRAGRVEGPWTFERLQSEVRQKRLSKFHEVSQDREEWFKAEDVPELFVVKVLLQRVRDPQPEVSPEANGPLPEVPNSPSQPRIWYIEKNGEPIGPFTSSEVREAWIAGRLDSDLAWREGFDNWLRMAEVPEFAHWFRGNETGDAIGHVHVDQSRVTKPKPPENQVSWLGISLVGLVFMVVLLAMVVATNSGSTLNKQHERDFFSLWNAEHAARIPKIQIAKQKSDIGGMLQEFQSLESSVNAQNTSNLEPTLRAAIQQYADTISGVCKALKQREKNDFESTMAQLPLALFRVKLSPQQQAELNSVRGRIQQADNQALSDALEKWERARFALAARDPN